MSELEKYEIKVCGALDMRPGLLNSSGRTDRAALARAFCYRFCRDHLGMKDTEIGRRYDRHLSGVGNALRMLRDRMDTDPAIRRIANEIERE